VKKIKTFANHLAYKGLVFRIYKELLGLGSSALTRHVQGPGFNPSTEKQKTLKIQQQKDMNKTT
jgi:hypothetical protein